MTSKDYKNKFEKLRDIFLEDDPMGLVDNGEPRNEYDPEIELAMVALINSKNQDEFEKKLERIFVNQFSLDAPPRHSLNNLAVKIWGSPQ